MTHCREPLLGRGGLILGRCLIASGPGGLARSGELPWVELTKRYATDLNAVDQYGQVLAIDGSTLVVGAPEKGVGVAYVWERVPWFTLWGLWSGELAQVFRTVEGDTDFGYAVTVSGDVMAARCATEVGSAVYVYERDAGGPDAWGEVARLELENAGPVQLLLGTVLAVGTPLAEVDGEIEAGAVELYERSATGGWHPGGRLTAPDARAGDHFGEALAGSGGRLLVGAPQADGLGVEAGAVMVFEGDEAGVWSEAGTIVAADGQSGDRFGVALAVEGERAIIGAEGDDDLGEDSGAAYLVEQEADGTWREVEKLLAADGAAGDGLGASVAIAGTVAVAGAPGHDLPDFVDGGAASIFERDEGGPQAWGEAARIAASEPGAGDRFGQSVATDGESVIVGIPFDDDRGRDAGAMAIFSRTELPEAEFCVDFGSCGGLDFAIRGNLAVGRRYYNCEGEPIFGIVRDGLRMPCTEDSPGAGQMALVCYPEWGCNILGWALYYMFDAPDGTFELGFHVADRDPPGTCSNGNVEDQLLKGPCPFNAQNGGQSLESAIQDGEP